MKLSEAIRLGAMIRPQVFGAFMKNGGSCAIGAALEAVGHNVEDFSPCYSEAAEAFPLLTRWADYDCPACVVQFAPGLWRRFDTVISHLNDQHKWTREQIADFVASIERSESPEADDAVDPSGVSNTGTLTPREKVSL